MIAVFGWLVALAVAGTPADAQAIYQRASTQFSAHEFRAAVSSFQQAIDLNPNYALAYKGLGMAQVELQNYDAAYKAWLKASELNGSDANTKYLMGRLFYEADLPNEAAAWLREALKLAPDDVPSTTYLGLCAETLGMDDTAGALYRKALSVTRLQPRPFPWVYLSFGNYLKKHGDEPQALRILEEGAEKSPEAHELTALGELLTTRHQPERAEQVLRKAIELDPSLAQPHYRLALLMRSMGRVAESQSELKTFQNLKSKEASAPKVMAIRK